MYQEKSGNPGFQAFRNYLSQKFDSADSRRRSSRRKKRSSSRESTTSAAAAADDEMALVQAPIQ
jgi:hypothetical protein